MRFFEALLEIQERRSDLDPRALEVLNLLCAADYTTKFPKDVDFAEIDSAMEQMEKLDSAGAVVRSFSSKVRTLPAAQSAGALFI
jgi:hypothetical protein